MNRIDWASMPEWVAAVAKTSGGQEVLVRKGEPDWRYAGLQDIQRRPEEPQEWNGEGLPPVGTVCEAFWPTDTKPDWLKFEVLFVGDVHCIARANGRELHYPKSHFDLEGVKFRQIRTPEQIAAEEREKALVEMAGLRSVGHMPTFEEACAIIYDAGYRKQDPKP